MDAKSALFVVLVLFLFLVAFDAAIDQAIKRSAYLEQCQATDTKYNCLLAWDKEAAK